MRDEQDNIDTMALKLEEFYSDTTTDDFFEFPEDIQKENTSPTERFRRQELIATGGMKNIFKVFDSKTDRFIALARLRSDVPESYSEGFMQEAYLTASLEHPNIISVYDVGVDENFFPYFTMELKVGDSLTSILEQINKKNSEYLEHYTLEKLLDIFTKVCDAVSYAHSRGVVHLDIKPDNIQVGQFGEVQLCDWGLGSHVDELNKENEEFFIKGTPGFMSPEQLDAKKRICVKSDIYALGALLYTILTGYTPNEGGLQTIIKNTLTGNIKLPTDRFPDLDIPQGINAVVSKAMATRKSSRYKSVEDLKQEVLKYLSGYSTSAQKAGFLQEFLLFYKRNSLVCQVVLSALLVITALTSYSMLKIKKSQGQTEDALSKLQVAFKDLEVAKDKEEEAFLESERNFTLYRKEKEKQLSLSNELIEVSYNDALGKMQAPIFFHDPLENTKDAINSLEAHYKLTGHQKTQNAIFQTYFIAQNYKKALEYVGDQTNPVLKELAEKHSSAGGDYRKYLSDINFLSIIKTLNQKCSHELKRSLIERMLVYHLALKKEKYTRPEILVEILKSWNPYWNCRKFYYDKTKQLLKVHGENLTYIAAKAGEYGSDYSFLRFLKINNLSISDSSIRSLRQLSGVSVNTLDIRDTKITNLRLIRDMASVSKLKVNTNQFPDAELQKLPETVELDLR